MVGMLQLPRHSLGPIWCPDHIRVQEQEMVGRLRDGHACGPRPYLDDHDVYNQTVNFEGDTVESPNGAMVDGTVNPAVGRPGTFYTFNVTLTSGATDASVHLYLTNDWDTGESAITNTSMPFSHNVVQWGGLFKDHPIERIGPLWFRVLCSTRRLPVGPGRSPMGLMDQLTPRTTTS